MLKRLISVLLILTLVLSFVLYGLQMLLRIMA